MINKFRVEFLEEAAIFLSTIEDKAREKIIYNIRKSQVVNDRDLFKKLNEDIWEFRTMYKKTYYRFFAFWDKELGDDTIVIATHGIIKKTDKTPQADLEKALRLRQQYLASKKI